MMRRRADGKQPDGESSHTASGNATVLKFKDTVMDTNYIARFYRLIRLSLRGKLVVLSCII